MTEKEDYYKVLQLSRDCTQEQIRMRYHELVRTCHPDHAQDKNAAGEIFALVNKAYSALHDPQLRKIYDDELAAAVGAKAIPPAAHPNGSVAQSSGQEPAMQPPRKAKADSEQPRPEPPSARTAPKAASGLSHFEQRITMPLPDIPARAAMIDFLSTQPSDQPVSPQGAFEKPMSLLDQAHAAAWRENWAAAEDLCTRYLRDNQDSSAAFELLGDINAQDGRTKQAVNFFRMAHKLDPSNDILEAKIACLRDAVHYTPSQSDAPDGASTPNDAPVHATHAPAEHRSIAPPEPPRKAFGWFSEIFRRSEAK